MNKLKFISIKLIMDLILSNLTFKNTAYWSQINWNKKGTTLVFEEVIENIYF